MSDVPLADIMANEDDSYNPDQMFALIGKLSDEMIRRTQRLSRKRELYAIDLYHRDEDVRDIWVGSPTGLDLDDSNRDCPLCVEPNREGPAAGWYARNSTEWLIGHSYCVSRAVMWGTAPGWIGADR